MSSENLTEEDLIASDPDYINAKRYNKSLKQFLEKHPNGSSIRLIAQSLNMEEEDVQELIDSTLSKLRDKLGA